MKLFFKSSNSKQKALPYFGFLLVIFIALELLFNTASVIFSNTTSRVRLKSAMFEFRGDTEVLFLGSSRFKDGISPDLYSKHFLEISGKNWRSFNGAITGANIERLDYFFNKAIQKKGLKYVVIEVSMPQLSRKKEDIIATEKDKDLDAKLSGFFAEKSKLIQWRKALRLDNLKNAPAILFSDYMQGSELYRQGIVSDLFNDKKTSVNKELLKPWTPLVIAPNTQHMSIDTADYSVVFNSFKNIMQKAKANKVNVLLVVPPLANNKKKEESHKEVLNLYQKLANVTQQKIYNFALLDISERYFRDKDSHLNKQGRDLFSVRVANLMAQNLIKN